MAIYRSGSTIKIIRRWIGWKAWLIATVASLIAGGIVGFAYTDNGVNFEGIIEIISLTQGITVALALYREKIIITPEEIIYKESLRKKRRVRIRDITKIRTVLARRARVEFSLNIFDRDRYSKNPFKISLSALSKDECRLLFGSILQRNPQVDADELSMQLRNGNFKTVYLFVGQTVAGNFLRQYRR